MCLILKSNLHRTLNGMILQYYYAYAYLNLRAQNENHKIDAKTLKTLNLPADQTCR